MGFPGSMLVKEIHIYETYNPGRTTEVSLWSEEHWVNVYNTTVETLTGVHCYRRILIVTIVSMSIWSAHDMLCTGVV